jgi:hypothetical protein
MLEREVGTEPTNVVLLTYGRESLPATKEQEIVCLFDLAKRMAEEVGVGVHRYCLRKYEECFRGTAAVKWMLKAGLAGSEKEALTLGNKMLISGLIYHVMIEHPFENEKLFYR